MTKIILWLSQTSKGRLFAALSWPFWALSIGMLFALPDHWTIGRIIMSVSVNYLLVLAYLAVITKGRVWSPFRGYSMQANMDRIKEMTIDRQVDIQDEIDKWADDFAGRFRYRKVNEYRYLFLRKKDAMAFKLVWG